MTIKFHAVMVDETGCEFGADVEAPDRETAYDRLREDYPESRVAQLESPEDTLRRETATYEAVRREIDGDDDWDPDWEEDLDDWDPEDDAEACLT